MWHLKDTTHPHPWHTSGSLGTSEHLWRESKRHNCANVSLIYCTNSEHSLLLFGAQNLWPAIKSCITVDKQPKAPCAETPFLAAHMKPHWPWATPLHPRSDHSTYFPSPSVALDAHARSDMQFPKQTIVFQLLVYHIQLPLPTHPNNHRNLHFISSSTCLSFSIAALSPVLSHFNEIHFF